MNWRPSQSPEWQTAKHAAAYRAFPRRGVGRGSSQGAKGSVRTTLCQPPVRREAVIDSEFFLHWNPLFPSSPQIVRHCCISDSVDSVEQPWLFAVVVHGDVEGIDSVRHSISDWLCY